MRQHEIKVGGLYLAKVSGRITTVRVERIVHPRFIVTNLSTRRRLTFYSAAKFRCETKSVKPYEQEHATALTNENELRTEQPVNPQQLDSSIAVHTTATSQVLLQEGVAVTDADLQNPTTQVSESVPSVDSSKEDEQCSDPMSAQQTQKLGQFSTATTSVAQSTENGTLKSLAAKIAANSIGRQVGSPVAGMTPNGEQESILALAIEQGLKVLVVGAGAGSGKTATCKMLEEVLQGRGLYTCFSRPLVDEAKTKFKKARCSTQHGLAYQQVGMKYQLRLNRERVKSWQIAKMLNIQPFTVILKGMGDPDVDGKPTDKTKIITAEFLAGQVLVAIRKFCQSADKEISSKHIGYVEGIDAFTEQTNEYGKTYKQRGRENNDTVKNYLVPFCQKAWADIVDPNGQLPFSHDCYVKIWQLQEGENRPLIQADYILLDEYQDTAEVFLDVIRQQTHALLVMVGDDNQRIYEWRGAVNAGDYFPDAPRRMLSQSYRFGQSVADVANTILATLDLPTKLVMRGMPSIPSRVVPISEEDVKCYIYRTNAGAVGRLMTATTEDKKPCLVGGKEYISDLTLWCQATIDLKAKRGTRFQELACFSDWKEVVEYAKTDEGKDFQLMVKLVEDFGAEKIRDALKNMPDERDADFAVITAHKSKGREWDNVKLGQDFPLENRMNDEERRLLYVAATRGKYQLDITECPPFCGGYEKSGDRAWVPGLKVLYTKPMPDEDELAAYFQREESGKGGHNKEERKEPVIAQTAQSAPVELVNGRPITYTKLYSGAWGIRSGGDLQPGQVVVVTKRSGQKDFKTVDKSVYTNHEDGVHLYSIK